MLGYTVDIEVEIIRNLTKADIVRFYDEFINPGSHKRSKISVHMHAAASPPPTPAPADDEIAEQPKTVLAQALSQFLSTQGVICADTTALSKALDNTDLTKPESIIASVSTFLSKEVKLADEKVKMVIAQGASVLKQLMPTLLGSAPSDVVGSQGEVIEDVYAFKAGLEMTKGARPVRPLVEFEESSVKL